MKHFPLRPWILVHANDNDALVPELWAQESLAILEENMVVANLVHRDFESEVAEYGDVVNTRRPSTFVSKRKTDTDDVTNQNAQATNVQVPLDQHHHVSFIIRDGEQSKSFKDLVSFYLQPALLAEAQAVDQILLGQVGRFLANKAGKLGTDPSRTTLLELGKVMNENKVPLAGRNLVIGPAPHAALLDIASIVEADKRGDAGTAMREASLGRVLGFDSFMCQNAITGLPSLSDTVTGAINKSGGEAVGATDVDVDGLSAAITAGTMFTIAGDMRPRRVTGTTGAGTPTNIEFTPALDYAVADDAVVTLYDPGAINLSAGYAANWIKPMTVDAFTLAPQAGQLFTIGTGSDPAVYSAILEQSITEISADRALAAAVLNDATVNLYPAGSYSFAFHRNAVALVTRPLIQPIAGTGALSSVQSYNGLSIRVVIQYDSEKQGHRVTVDFLMGVGLLDVNLGAALLS